jgi:cysteine desulfurase / selenocysteine lyase
MACIVDPFNEIETSCERNGHPIKGKRAKGQKGKSEGCPHSRLDDAISLTLRMSGRTEPVTVSARTPAHEVIDWRARMVGLDEPAPLVDGRLTRHINLDNAASTPPLRDVVEAVQRFLPWYSSVHRGTGYKSRVSTAAYDAAHDVIARFVGADTRRNTVIFGRNTTDALNKLAFRYPLSDRDVILTTVMEHHSNDLPWRGRADVVRAGVTADGRLDEADMDRLFARHGSRIALVVVSGASNVTGFVQPIHRLARRAHDVGASIVVDAAQLAPHRRLDMRPDDDPEHLDFVALSGHKMYAPFGTGALVGRRDVFLRDGPEYRGGGTVEIVTDTDVEWADLPDREEAGSPNVVGAVAMATAAQTLMDAGMEHVARHEASLTAYALERLRSVPAVRVYGDAEPRVGAGPDDLVDRVGVIAFNVGDIPHALVAAVLADEGGIAVRSGCFCAQPYVARLLGLSDVDLARTHRAQRAGDRSRRPGMVRISLGVYNTSDDIDRAIELLARIARGGFERRYRVVAATGAWEPIDCGEPGPAPGDGLRGASPARLAAGS